MKQALSQNKCQPAVDLLQNKLQEDNFTYQELVDLCQKFPDCKDELHTHYAWWEELDVLKEVPETSEGLRKNFQLLLDEAKYEHSIKGSQRTIGINWPTIVRKWSPLAATFVIGVLLGGLFLSGKFGNSIFERKAELASEPKTELALLTSNSAMDRLQALQQTKESPELDDQIIGILNQILLEDENVSVRLSALEAMMFFSDNPKVKENLIRAIPHQNSPILQLTLAEVALALDNERAKTKIQELLQQKQLELEVKIKLEDHLKI